MMNLTNKEITFLEEQKDILNKVPTDWLAFFNNMSKNKTLSRVNTFRIVVFLTQNGFDIMEFRNEVFLSIMEESCNIFRGFSKIAGSDVNTISLNDLGDVIVHLFTEGERERVDLDTLIRKVNFLGAENEKN